MKVRTILSAPRMEKQMADKFQLQVITPERVVFKGEVNEVYAPGFLGEFGVRPGHKPYLVLLEIGPLKIRKDNQWILAALNSGFAEVDYDSMRILAETCEMCDEIDKERAQRAKARAEENLKKLDPIKDEQEFQASRAALARALNRLEVAGKKGV